MAHAGAPNRAKGVKENTKEAFDQSLRIEGALAGEGDIIVSSDEVCFMYHGSADAAEQARTGLLVRDDLEKRPAAEIERLLGDETVRLEEVLTTHRERFFNLDLETERAARFGPQLVERLGRLKWANFASFDDERLNIAAKTLGDGDAKKGYKRASFSAGPKESVALLELAFTGNLEARDTLLRSGASRLQLPYGMAVPRRLAAQPLQKIFNIDTSGISPEDTQGEAALWDILTAGIFNEEVDRNAILRVQVSAGMVALAKELGYGVDLWTLKKKSDIHRAIEIGTDWLITDDVPYTQRAIKEHRAAA